MTINTPFERVEGVLASRLGYRAYYRTTAVNEIVTWRQIVLVLHELEVVRATMMEWQVHI